MSIAPIRPSPFAASVAIRTQPSAVTPLAHTTDVARAAPGHGHALADILARLAIEAEQFRTKTV